MTNLEAKQKAIKKIISDYYDKYPKVEPFVQNNGFFPITNGYVSNLNTNVREFYNSVEKVFLSAEDHEEYFSHFIPKELSDLIEEADNNNGWIRIEPNGSNLPNDGKKYDVFVKGSKFRKTAFIDKGNWIYESEGNLWRVQWVSHYKPITPELKPIY